MSFIKRNISSWRYILGALVLIFFASIMLWTSTEGEPPVLVGFENFSTEELELSAVEKLKNNGELRDAANSFIKKVAESYLDETPLEYPEALNINKSWKMTVTAYLQGEARGTGAGEGEILSFVLERAVKGALAAGNINKDSLDGTSFLIRLLSPVEYSFIGHEGTGAEIVSGLAPVREIDKEILREKIEQGKEFLYKMEDPEEHGFHKYYYALEDTFELRLHTVYSASIIYTFLYLYDLEQDEEILGHLDDWGDFLLSMQNNDKEDARYGAFHYSYYLKTGEIEQKYVVGTSALSIFTLLRLHEITNDAKYLEAAKLAGDWLITMQNPDGSMKPYVRYENGKWYHAVKESLLYNGQSLSSLSKLYAATKDKRYYDAAENIAKRYAEKYEKEHSYIEGDYRAKNPISNSWVVMSLMDFYKVNGDDYYKNIIFELSAKILENQADDIGNLVDYGSWGGAYSSSGMGWINEVMVDTYGFCKEQGRVDCEKYKEPIIKTIRWLVQNTYSEESNFLVKNSQKSLGGVFWNKDHRYVRTDSVCHALNGYARIINYLDDGVLLSVPENTLEEIFTQ